MILCYNAKDKLNTVKASLIFFLHFTNVGLKGYKILF